MIAPFTVLNISRKKSEVEIYCKNEMTKEEKIIRFRSVICIYMQSCRFWAGGE